MPETRYCVIGPSPTQCFHEKRRALSYARAARSAGMKAKVQRRAVAAHGVKMGVGRSRRRRRSRR